MGQRVVDSPQSKGTEIDIKHLALSSQKYRLGSVFREKPIPDPGSRGKKVTGSRIRTATLLWASDVCVCQPLPTQTPLTMLFCPEYLVNTYSTK